MKIRIEVLLFLVATALLLTGGAVGADRSAAAVRADEPAAPAAGTGGSAAAVRAQESASPQPATGSAEEEVLDQARRLLDQDKAQEARTLLADYLKSDPQSIAGWKLMGTAHRKLGDNEEALKAYAMALKLDPSELEALFWTGTLNRWAGRWKESLAAFSKALETNPDDVGCLIGRARALIHMGTFDHAERDLRQAMNRSPKNAEAASLLAEVLARQNQLDAARAELEKVFGPAEVQKELGDLYREKELYGEAIELYRAALNLRPDESEWRRALAYTLTRERDLEAALEEYRMLAETNPDDTDAQFWVGTLSRWKGLDQEAEKAYREVLRVKPDDAAAMTGLVRVLRKQGRRDEALEWAQRAVQVAPDNAEAQTVLGVELVHAGEAREATRHFERALELNPGDSEVQRELLSAKRTGFQTLGASYKLSDAQALEGRERGLDADPYPIPMKYRSDEYVVWYEVPGAGWRKIGGEAGLSYDRLDNLRFDRTVYDVRALTVRARLARSLGKGGMLEGSAGVRHYADINEGDDLADETFGVYDLRWDISGRRDELTVKTDRTQVLVRGAAENTYFGIVKVTGFGITHNRILNDYVNYRTSYTLSDYSDGNTTHYFSSGPDIYWRRNTFSPRIRYWPLQRYDLDDKNRMQFVAVTSIGSSYRAYLGKAWGASAGYWYSLYDDEQGDKNKAHNWSGKLTYHPSWSGPLFVGAETEGNLFSEPLGQRRGYISYDTQSYAALAGLEHDWADGLYRFSIARTWEKDEIADWFDSFVILGYLDTWLGPSVKLAFDGRFYRNNLDEYYGPNKEEEVQRYFVSLRYAF